MLHDDNGDGFLDTPLKVSKSDETGGAIIPGSYVAQYGGRFLHSRIGGPGYYHGGMVNPYVMNLNTNQARAVYQTGLYFKIKKVRGVALILSGSYREQSPCMTLLLYYLSN